MNFLRFISVTSALILMITHADAATLQASTSPAILGEYHSQIWSGGTVLSGTTRLRQDASGISGDYSMNEEKGVTLGQLHECHAQTAHRWSCLWSDPYGVGVLIMTFSADFAGFDGDWHMSQAPSAEHGMRWDGQRVQMTKPDTITP